MSTSPTSESTPLEEQLTQKPPLGLEKSKEAPLDLNVVEGSSQLETEEPRTQDAAPTNTRKGQGKKFPEAAAAAATSTDQESDFEDEIPGHSILCIKPGRVFRPWNDTNRRVASDCTLHRIAKKLEVPSGGGGRRRRDYMDGMNPILYRGWRKYIDPVLYKCFLGEKNHAKLELLLQDDFPTDSSEEEESTQSMSEDSDSDATVVIDIECETDPDESDTTVNPNGLPGPSGQPTSSPAGSLRKKLKRDRVFMKYSKKFYKITLVEFYKSEPPGKPEDEDLFPLKFFAGVEVKAPIAYDIMGLFREDEMHFLVLAPIFSKDKSRGQQPSNLGNMYGASTRNEDTSGSDHITQDVGEDEENEDEESEEIEIDSDLYEYLRNKK